MIIVMLTTVTWDNDLETRSHLNDCYLTDINPSYQKPKIADCNHRIYLLNWFELMRDPNSAIMVSLFFNVLHDSLDLIEK